MSKVEVSYTGSDNSIDLLLKSNDSAVDLSGTTQVSVKIGKSLITSTGIGGSTADISWAGVGYATGEVRLHLGNLSSLVTGVYDTYLSAKDSSTPNGIVWGPIPIEIKSNPMST